MRDDLHKKAPIPRKAQHVFKLALRPADRYHPERLTDAAARALDQAVKRGLSPSTIQAFTDDGRQGEMFWNLSANQQACSPLEAALFAQMRAESLRISGRKLLECELKAWGASYAREVRATLIADGTVGEISKVVRAFSSAFDTAASLVAESICSGVPISRSTQDLALGENLIAPGNKAFQK